ncbi:MAG: hypothetical protein Tsb007_16730 [Rhizobacter sp.]
MLPLLTAIDTNVSRLSPDDGHAFGPAMLGNWIAPGMAAIHEGVPVSSGGVVNTNELRATQKVVENHRSSNCLKAQLPCKADELNLQLIAGLDLKNRQIVPQKHPLPRLANPQPIAVSHPLTTLTPVISDSCQLLQLCRPRT